MRGVFGHSATGCFAHRLRRYNGLETFVRQKIDSDDSSWLPNENALFLEAGDEDDEENRSHEGFVRHSLEMVQKRLSTLANLHAADMKTMKRDIALLASSVEFEA